MSVRHEVLVLDFNFEVDVGTHLRSTVSEQRGGMGRSLPSKDRGGGRLVQFSCAGLSVLTTELQRLQSKQRCSQNTVSGPVTDKAPISAHQRRLASRCVIDLAASVHY